MADDKGSSGPAPADRERGLIDAARRQAQARPAETGLHGSGGLISDDSNAPAFSPPTTAIPGYEILREIHRGGQGVVYQALQKSTRRKVAIKVMREGPFAGPRDRARFEREVQILGQLNHRNIVAIHDSGSASGSFYMVMDYISGQSLDAYVAEEGGSQSARAQTRGSFVQETLRLGAKICNAVHAAHLRGIIHRDLKPGNIRVDANGEPYILDFGLAKVTATELTDESRPRVMSQTGQFIGSLPWASPEQAQGQPERIDIRTDVYSLGVILYQMLTGASPYPVTGQMGEVLDHIAHTEPARPSTIRSLKGRIGDEVETILLRCLNKDPERRYQSAGELARDINRYLAGEPIEAKRDSPLANWYMLRKILRRYRVPAAVAAAFGVLIVVFAGAMTVMYRHAVQETRTAEKLSAYLEDTLVAIDPDVFKGANPDALRDELDRRARRAEEALADAPEALATVRDVLGMLYLKLGVNDVAGELLRTALESRQALYGDDDPDTASSLNNLAKWYIEAESNYAEAEGYSRQALAVYRNLFDQGEAGGEDVAESLNILACAIKKQSRFPDAETHYREALSIRREVLGDGHLDVAGTQNDLALLLRDMGHAAEAETLLSQALGTVEQLLGIRDTRVATIQADLGSLLRLRGEFERAEDLLQQAYDTRMELLGENNNATVVSMNKLALLLTDQGRYAEAEDLARRTLELRREVLPEKHKHIAVSQHNLARVLLAKGNYAAAEGLERQALDLWCESLGERHGHVASGYHQLAKILRGLDEYEKAEEHCRHALDIRQEVIPDKHAALGDSYLLLGQLGLDQGNPTQAEEPFRESVHHYQAKWPEGHWKISSAQSALGECLAALARDAEAESLLVDSYQAITGARGATDEHTIEALRRVVDYYESRGDAATARDYESMLPADAD